MKIDKGFIRKFAVCGFGAILKNNVSRAQACDGVWEVLWEGKGVQA